MGNIDEDKIKQVYSIAKGLHGKKWEAIKKLHIDTGMNANSANFYIEAFLAMMEGRTYQKTINYKAHIYFLKKIEKDFDKKTFEKALLSVKKHIVFYEETENHPLPGIRKVYQEFLKKL